jgi:hypothetical protein
MEKLNRPEFEALVDRVAAGEITRAQAAQIASETVGVSPNTFLSWVRSSGAAARLKNVRGTVGQRNVHAHKDPAVVKAYDDAVALALSGKVSVRQAAAAHNVSYPWLLAKVRKVQPAKATAERIEVVRYTTANEEAVKRLEEAVQ